MTAGYFHRVSEETPTHFWINNPSDQDLEKALAAGAINCTTNPSYCSKLIANEPGYLPGVIDGVIEEIEDDNAAAERIYHLAAQRIMRGFLPLYEASGGVHGYVTIQGDPRAEHDPDNIVNEALRARQLGVNYMAKVPTTQAGMQAMEELIVRNVPLCATEIFSLSQALYVSELYRRVSRKSGNHPPIFVTHITGIYDEYLGGIVQREHIDVSPDVLSQAGCAVARQVYCVLKQRGYEGTMLGGGARGTQHFTEMVGGDVHITINWSMAQELIDVDGPVVPRMDTLTSKAVVEEMEAKLPGFFRAYRLDGLAVEEFEDFGPVVLFRTMFLNGYARLLEEVATRRRRMRKATS